MNARDEYPPNYTSPDQHAAMCAEIDRLRAENAELRSDLDDLNDEICECKVLEITTERDALRAALVKWKRAWASYPYGGDFLAECAMLALAPDDEWRIE